MEYIIKTIFVFLMDMIPDLITVFLGVLGALWVARWQIRKQDIVQKQSDRERLTLLYNRVAQELSNDWYTLKELKNVLDQSEHSRFDVLNWGISVVDSISTAAYDNLLHSGLDRYLPSNIDENLYMAYNNIIGISNEVRKARLASEFYSGYRSDTQKVDSEYEKIKLSLSGVFHLMNEKIVVIDNYKKELDKTQNGA